MSIRPYLVLMLDALDREIRPDLSTPRSRSTALALSRLLQRIIANSDGSDDLDTPDAFFGGTTFRRSMAREARTRIAADQPKGFEWSRDMSRWEASRYAEVAARLTQVSPMLNASYGQVAPIDRDTLERYLRRRFSNAELSISSLRSILGGHSKQTAVVDLTACPELPEKIIVRMERASGVMPTSIPKEFPILQLLHSRGVAVPEPFLLEEADRSLGGTFLIVAALPGTTEIGYFMNPPKRPELARQVARQLGRLHSIDEGALEALGQAVPRMSMDSISRELEEVERAWESLPSPWSVCGPYALKWLRQNLHLSQGERRLIHCDLDFHNVLADGNGLTALLDWETASLGNPAYDLGYIRWSVEQLMPWTEFIAEYEAAGGRPSTPAQIDFFSIWGIMRLAGPLMCKCRQMIEQGQTRQIDYALVSIDILQRCMHRFAADLARTGID